MIRLTSVYRLKGRGIELLYALLGERGDDESISHKAMPTLQEHAEFVRSVPYQAWYFVMVGDEPVGSVYLSRQREIGVFIFKAHQGKGYGEAAVKALMAKWPGRFLANMNPENGRSAAFFAKLGFRHVQNTYSREAQ